MSRRRIERERLLAGVKKAVKQLMEEAVTRKFVHEESGNVMTLCVEVEACFSHCVRTKLFMPSSTFGLVLGRLAHIYTPAGELHRICNEIMAGLVSNGVTHSTKSSRTKATSGSVNEMESLRQRLQSFKTRYLNQHSKIKPNPTAVRVLWVHIALVEKMMAGILEIVLRNVSHFYEDSALLAHAVDGPIFANLLAGPNVLEFSKIKTSNHLRTDPPAPELIDKQRLFTACHKDSACSLSDLPSLEKLPGSHSVGETTACTQVKEHIEMLHQTAHSTLLFAKNNIIVHKDSKSSDGIPGYLSLHQFNDQVILKWTPNFLVWPKPDLQPELEDDELSHSLDLVVSLDIRKIVSIHCHKQSDESEQTQLIAQDGRQFPPLIFPPGGSLTSFLVSLEIGLLPHGRLNPPLWARRSKRDSIFPTRRKSQHQGKIALQPIDYVVPDDPYKDAKQATNYYVFHVIHGVETGVKAGLRELCKPLSNGSSMNASLSSERHSSRMSSDSSNRCSLVAELNGDSDEIGSERSVESSCERLYENSLGSPIQSAYEQIMHQIKSRAFYGWLSHVRHMSYLRKHLLNFVSGNIIPVDKPTDATGGVTAELWESVLSRGDVCEKNELLRLTYYGGIEPEVRSKVWPYLIGHYDFGLRATERALLDTEMRTTYKSKLDEWTTIEREWKKQTRQLKAKQRQSANEHDGDGLDLSNYANLSSDHSPVDERLDSFTVSSREPSLSPVQRLSGGDVPDGNDTEEVNGLLEELDLDSGCEDLVADSSAISILQQFDDKLVDLLKVNIERIDKDVVRCDRTHPYFQKTKNLVKLRNVLVSYVWDGRLNPGYIQGMCDIVAPLLLVFDDEALVWNCFQKVMITLAANFNTSERMDLSFSNLRALLKVMDPDLHELLHEHDCTHLYFTHRWFLIDFKREFGYDGIFLAWEVIWAAAHCASQQFRIFLALALLQQYKHILLDNEMGFTDITKFFNEMAEKHDVSEVLQRARQLAADLYNELHYGSTNVLSFQTS